MKKILVIDGNSIINRAYYGIRLLTTKSGKYTNAIYGMINIISKQLDALKPDYAAVAFDLKAPTFRHKMYEHYKEGRHPTPEELLSQFDDAKECLHLMGINVLELEGYEPDDIQGTVAKMAHGCDLPTESYILSGDRDLLQLIDDKTTVLLATNQDTLKMHEEQFLEKYGILPSQFVDMKALMGDSSDNIPGVRGIGEKTAAQLIQNFESLEGIYASLDDKRITKATRAKLEADKDNAYLSRELARIKIDVPLGRTLEDLRYTGPNKPQLYKKFSELELNSFIAKFGLNDTAEVLTETKAEETIYEDITLSELSKNCDTPIALYYNGPEIYLYSREIGSRIFRGEPSELSSILAGREIICYDAKSLMHQFSRLGLDLSKSVMRDLMIYAYILNPGSGIASLNSLLSMFLHKSVPDGAPCPELMFLAESVIKSKILEDGMEKILEELEIPLINILYNIEKRGFSINTAGMLEYAEALGNLASDLSERIYMQAGEVFNINSPKQLGELLFVKLGLPYSKKSTKSGYSTDAETLESLRPISPIVDDILEYRQVTKLKNTYASALPPLCDENSRLHTDFKQALTATGRLSSADPNLQNIPIRTKLGREMRRYFIAKEGYTLVDADYSQIELRLLAHISEDYNMSEAFKDGKDIHRKTASAVFGLPEEDVTEDMRKRAKAVNFGIVYGISGFSLAKDIGTTTAEASRYIKNYLMNYPSIDRYLDEVVKKAAEDGYTTTPMGRRRYIPELKSSNGMQRAFGKRVAMNAPIQGAAADIMKLAMIKTDAALKEANIDAAIVMQVHDELVIEVKDEDCKKCMQIVKQAMESALTLSVPLTVDVTSGKNWLEQE